jgi:hypothetical protein
VCNFNLFRHAERLELICAVPEIRPVPPFIAGPVWSFVGRVSDCTRISLGFKHRTAEASVRYNGFYLFQLGDASDLKQWIIKDPVPVRGEVVPTRETGRQPKAQSLRPSDDAGKALPEAQYGTELQTNAAQMRSHGASAVLEIHQSR